MYGSCMFSPMFVALHIIIHASGLFSLVFMFILVVCVCVFVFWNVCVIVLYICSSVISVYCVLLCPYLHSALNGVVLIVRSNVLCGAYAFVVSSSMYWYGYIIVRFPVLNSFICTFDAEILIKALI